jgi:hypothetical protein
MDFKPAAGQTKGSVVKQGQQIVTEMESQVPTKDKLFETQLSLDSPPLTSRTMQRYGVDDSSPGFPCG